MQSLRDKLLKAGLVTEDAAKKAEADKAPSPAPVGRSRPPSTSAPRRDAAPPPSVRIPKLPPLPGSKEAHRLLSKRQLELDRAIREKVHAHQVPMEPGATTFYFVTRKNRLRRLELTESQAKALETGALAVVERPDPDKIEHALVPPEVAQELLALSARAVRFLNRPGSQVGFLSEAEIHARASEATGDEGPEANEADLEPGATEPPTAASDDSQGAPESGSAPGPAPRPEEPATFITIKRAPRA